MTVRVKANGRRNLESEITYLRTFVAQLRRKLGDDAAHPSMIATEPGMGYRWLA